MIDLLPAQQKEELREEEKLKLVLILGIVFISFLLSIALILFLIKNYISEGLEIQKILLEEKEKIISLEKGLEKEIKDSNLFLSNLNSFYQERLDITKILEKLSLTLPPKTYLTNFNFLTQKEGLAQISLYGFCPSRELLLSFKENLEKVEEFGDVFFPPENWVKPTDINFNLSFKLIKK